MRACFDACRYIVGWRRKQETGFDGVEYDAAWNARAEKTMW